MYIEEDGLVIRNAVLQDAVILCNWWNDGRIMAHAGFPRGLGTTVQEIEEKLSKDDDYNRRLIIEVNGMPSGEMCYRTVGNGIAEIGIKICDFTMQEKGYGTKLLHMLIKFLFNEMDYGLIKLDTNINNKRAQHVYEKLGFCRAGLRKDAWKDQMGVLQTAVDYELARQTCGG